jgi:glycosyltransferase involved in cell wall biosynthesis
MQQQLLFRREKAVMIHKGMDMEWFRDVKPVPRKDMGILQNAIVAGCVANVRRIKGVPFLLESTYYIRRDIPLHILLIGTGMDSDRFLRLIASSPLKNNIHILGYREDIYEVIAACDIYIQPSLNESLSRSVMEAMCLGVPCVVSDAGGLVELVEHEKSGLIVERGNPRALAQAIEKMAGDAGMRKAFAEEAVKRMQQIFPLDNMVANTLNLYNKAVR